MLPSTDPSIRKAKKRINTWFLDNQWCIKSNRFSLCINLFLVVLVIFLYISKSGMITFFEAEIDNVNNEMAEFQEILEKEMEDKILLMKQLEITKSNIKEKGNLLSQKEEILRLKLQTIDDVKEGLDLVEKKIRDIETSAPTLNFDKVNNNNNQQQQQQQHVTKVSSTPQVSKLPSAGEDTDRMLAVKDAFLHAWNSYKTYAWGMDELKPVSGTFFNWLGLGVTIVDSLDTLWIMNLKDEFRLARDWIADNLTFDRDRDVSVFETTIRELGGLLSAYELSRDRVFLTKSMDLADRLLTAFNTPTKIPYSSVNLLSRKAKALSWTAGASILSEIGTLQLEFLYLAHHTNNPDYAALPLEVFRHLDKLEKDKGLYNLYVNVNTGKFQGAEVSLGALGDSFYEYMLKLWLMTGKQFDGYKRMYKESSVGIKDVLVQTTKSGYKYVSQIGRSGQTEQKMEHLTCFSGGMFALGSMHHVNEGKESEDLDLGGEITRSCHESYTRTATKIGPEFFEFRNGQDFTVPNSGRHYLLRPETVESYFIMWRTTHQQKYRDWAWEAFQAIEQHCRLDKGYSGLNDVNNAKTGHDDLQQSFFLAETLKYLYLIFADDSVIPLDKYVFNTEAHPFGIFDTPVSQWNPEIVDHLLDV